MNYSHAIRKIRKREAFPISFSKFCYSVHNRQQVFLQVKETDYQKFNFKIFVNQTFNIKYKPIQQKVPRWDKD